jgi:hypothetical protein
MDTNEQEKIQVEPLTEVYVDGSDVQSIRDFYEHFSINVQDYLETALTDFEKAVQNNADKDVLIQKQNEVRVALCRSMVESESAVFKNPLLDVVIKNSQNILFNAKFDEQVRETLKKD